MVRRPSTTGGGFINAGSAPIASSNPVQQFTARFSCASPTFMPIPSAFAKARDFSVESTWLIMQCRVPPGSDMQSAGGTWHAPGVERSSYFLVSDGFVSSMASHEVDGRPAHTPSGRGYSSDDSAIPTQRHNRHVTPPARPSATVDNDFVVADNQDDHMSVDGAGERNRGTADGAGMQDVASGRSTEDVGKPSQATLTDSAKKNKPWVLEEKVDLAEGMRG
ncbi:hypothetical protein CBR_g45961 [Chara braunii]|uniref:Uncharacterized protein n=1 Tax=Chara braunii TaxID=69332 RepID=A0A388LZV8_CHABU|nr:hypothetical protein CBR_g45961 [Chara braunii]|eukprot:GBG87805.1 hypothetical protein CBR_g45961 [Chara braunii]